MSYSSYIEIADPAAENELWVHSLAADGGEGPRYDTMQGLVVVLAVRGQRLASVLDKSIERGPEQVRYVVVPVEKVEQIISTIGDSAKLPGATNTPFFNPVSLWTPLLEARPEETMFARHAVLGGGSMNMSEAAKINYRHIRCVGPTVLDLLNNISNPADQEFTFFFPPESVYRLREHLTAAARVARMSAFDDLNVDFSHPRRRVKKTILNDIWISKTATAATEVLGQLTSDERAQILDILQTASRDGIEAEEVAQKIQTDVPNAHGLVALLSAKSGVAATWITVLLMVITLVLMQWGDHAPSTVINSDQRVTNITQNISIDGPTTVADLQKLIRTAQNAEKKLRNAQSKSIDRPKLQPADPCWCGSGSHFKHCHGRQRKR